MKSFRFNLQPVRELRAHKEEKARERYAAALRACDEASLLAQAARLDLKKAWTAFSEKMSSGINGQDLAQARAWCVVLELKLKERTTFLEQTRLAAKSVETELLKATQESEAMERFYEKSRQGHQKEVARRDQQGLDELAVQMVRSPLRLSNSTTH